MPSPQSAGGGAHSKHKLWFGCRDRVAGGTWLGISAYGRAGMLTNYHQFPKRSENAALQEGERRAARYQAASYASLLATVVVAVASALLFARSSPDSDAAATAAAAAEDDGTSKEDERQHDAARSSSSSSGFASQVWFVGAAVAAVGLALLTARLQLAAKRSAHQVAVHKPDPASGPPPPSRGRLLLNFLTQTVELESEEEEEEEEEERDNGTNRGSGSGSGSGSSSGGGVGLKRRYSEDAEGAWSAGRCGSPRTQAAVANAQNFSAELAASGFERFNGFNMIFGDEGNRWFYANHSMGDR